MGSGAVAIPAMTAAQGAAGAAGGTVGGAAPAAAAAGPPADMLDAGGRIAPTIGSGGGAQTGGASPLQIGPGGKYGGIEGAGGSRSFPGGGSQISGVPDDWLPYQVPKTGFGRFAQRLGGADPAARNAEFLANKQRFGMETAMDMEKQARSEQGMWNRQKDEQGFQQGQQARRTQAERDAERERRGFISQHDWNMAQWRAQNEERLKNLDRMEERAARFNSYDPIVQEDTAAQMREAQLGRMQAPVGVGSGMLWDYRNPSQIGVIDRGSDPYTTLGAGGEIVSVPARQPGVNFVPIGGGSSMPMAAPQSNVPQVNPNNLEFVAPPMQPPIGTQQPAAPSGGFLDTLGRWLRTQGGSRPGMYPSSPR